MQNIKITPETEYYFFYENRKLSLLEFYNNSPAGNWQASSNRKRMPEKFSLFVKQNSIEIKHDLSSRSKINHRYLECYDSDEINMLNTIKDFTVQKTPYPLELKHSIKINGPICFELQCNICISGNTQVNQYVSLTDMYMCMINREKYSPTEKYRYYNNTNLKVNILTDDDYYSISMRNIHINGQYICDYTLRELDILAKSQRYILGPNSAITGETIESYYINLSTEISIVDYKTDFPYSFQILKMLVESRSTKYVVLYRYTSASLYNEILDLPVEVVIRN